MYCQLCGSKLAQAFIAGRERPVCSRCGFIVYRNPVPASLIAVLVEDKILLIRRAVEPLKGYWAPPSGYIEDDEGSEQAAIRETREEANTEVAVDGLLGVYSRAGMGVVIIAYYGRALSTVPQAGEEATEARFFPLSELPSQLPPVGKTPLDSWVFEVICEVMGKCQEMVSRRS